MHTNYLSCLETAIHFNLGNTDIVGKWERIYYEKDHMHSTKSNVEEREI